MMNVSSDALSTKENNNEHARNDDRDWKGEEGETQREDKATKPATSKKTAKTTKAKSGSKAAIVLDLMKRKEGATLVEIAKATDWQNHSIRGFVSGHVIKKLGLKVESTKCEAGERTYRIVK
jgi:hypothetical protein